MAKRTEGPFFKPVSSHPDFPKMEKELLSHWYRAGIVKKYLTKNNKSRKLFRFLDGPITANNPMGVHHAWGRTYKDLWQRYKNMQGYRQRFQNGFDAQGLWVEVNVERELKLKSKHDIENLVPGDKFRSIARFVEACKERVNHFVKVQTLQSKRLGYFMDWDNSYITYSPENNYMIWNFLKRCHERGLVYEGLDAVPWCPRCATAISNHEILTEGYRELTHTAVTLKYPIAGRVREYLLVWTTTPWTLPANVAIAVNPKIIYSRVKVGRDLPAQAGIYYIARDRIVPVLGRDVEVLEELTGDRLLNISYKGPFDNLPAVDSARRENPRTFHKTIDGGELVTSEEGTGLVHIAPGAGHEDFVLGRKFELPTIMVIDEQAHFIDGFAFLTGRRAADARPIINYLKKEKPEGSKMGWLVKQEEYSHRYPVCWRCETELVFRAVPEWYIAMDPIREKMAEMAKKITWIPEFAKERELDWIRNMGDWLISKKRYWGLALPIWRCSACGWFTVIAGKEELKERAVEGWEKFSGHSPHRPWIDEVKVTCERCSERASRIPDVGNPWLDAGIVPFSTLIDPRSKKVSYMTDKKYWQEWFPADFITESFPGQFKGWFYSLLAMSAVLENVQPFKTVLGFATLFGEDGRPMHKSWGNAVEFGEGADKIGVDVMRWMYAKASPAQNLLFGYTLADETRRNFHLPLWNVYNFFVTYANFDKWSPRGARVPKVPRVSSILDKWILARLKEMAYNVGQSLDKYDAQTASSEIERFVDDLSTWYIRRSRSRVGPSNTDTTDKEEFYPTTYFVLVTLSQLLAPFLPYLSEFIFTYLTHEESVHLTQWPDTPAPDTREIELIATMHELREAAQVGHAMRKTAGIKVRQPLNRATVGAPSKSPTRPFLTLLGEELNVKEVVWKKKRVQKAVVTLNTRITPVLVEEGEARELVRRIQEERRRLGLGLTERVRVTVPHIPTDKKLFNWIKAKTLAQDLSQGDEFIVTKME